MRPDIRPVGPVRRVLRGILDRDTSFASPAWFREPALRPSLRRQGAGAIVVLSPGSIPTTSIYLSSRLPAANATVIDTLATQPRHEPAAGSELVLVRHAPRPWLRWIRQHCAAFRRIALLMDDDMPQALAAPELPLGYALRTARRHRDVKRLLAGCCDELWLSTPELLRRYPGPQGRVLEPLYLAAPGGEGEAPASEPTYFYHGTRAHLEEIRWLVPVVARVQQRCPDAVFEVFGDAEVARLFTGIPRVRVRPWLSWPDYLDYSRTRRFRVGLAPCLDTPFNRARSAVKVFDITRLGAVGVYASLEPYAGMVRHGETGMLCPATEQDWVEATVSLLQEPGRASAMAAAALRGCTLHRDGHAHWPPPDEHGSG